MLFRADKRVGPGPQGDWRLRLVVFSAGVVAITLTALFAALNPVVMDRLQNIIFDNYQRLAPRQASDAPLVLVDIDEASIDKVGQWPWPRTQIATIVNRLGELGAATIAFDMVFAEADRTSPQAVVGQLRQMGATIELPAGTQLDNDAVLAKAFAANPVVAGIAISDETSAPLPEPKAGFSFGGADPKSYLPAFKGGVTDLKVLTDAAPGLGSFSFMPSGDGVIRTLPLVASAQGRLYPTLTVEALRLAQGAGSFIIRSTGASGEGDGGEPAMTAFKDGDLAIPTGPHGEFQIYYSGLPHLPVVPAATLLDPVASAAVADKIANHIVIIGTSAVGLRDLVATPLNASMPGARVQAEVMDQILGQTFLSRPDWAFGAEVTAAIGLGFVVIGLEAFAGVVVSTAGALLMLGLAGAGSWLAFTQQHLLLAPIMPGAAVILAFVATTPAVLLWTDREKRFIRGAFGRYLSPDLVARLASSPASLRLGGEARYLTVLFSDIRDFTAFSEKLSPTELTRLLNNFLTPATDVLLNAEATIDKYIGDAIMAFWNAPLDIADHPRKACNAALRLIEAIEALNAREGLSLRIGIGLHSGECLVGNLGSNQRFSYSAIGDTVNLASRVEGLTKQYQIPIMVTGTTRHDVPDLAFLEADLVQVKGRSQPTPVFALVGDAAYAASPAFAALAEAHGRLVANYRALQFDAAAAALETARAAAPQAIRGLYGVYAERLDEMRIAPPAPGWDGIYRARQK